MTTLTMVTFLGLISSQVTLAQFSSSISSSSVSVCDAFNDIPDSSYGDFWKESSQCSPCVAHPKCGYCLSTLTCIEGDEYGTLDGSPCPAFIFKEIPPHEVKALTLQSEQDRSIPIPRVCPKKPQCDDFADCDRCAAAPECAWCASRSECMVVSEVFSSNSSLACRGTVFDLPCPNSFTAVNRVVGNLVITQDPIFGGGELRVSGRASLSSIAGYI